VETTLPFASAGSIFTCGPSEEFGRVPRGSAISFNTLFFAKSYLDSCP
jgi:hypothetical protein